MTQLLLTDRIQALIENLEPIDQIYPEIDTRHCLVQWAIDSQVNHLSPQIDLLLKRFDIDKIWYLAYKKSGVRASKTQIDSESWLELACLLLADTLLNDHNLNKELALKRTNVLYKIKDQCPNSPLWREQFFGQSLLDIVNADYKKRLQSSGAASPATLNRQITALTPEGKPRTIPLTVLFYEGPIARAYLAMLHHLNLRPVKIIALIAANDVASKKPVGKWLPLGLRKNYAASIQTNKIHYWPKFIAKNQAPLLANIKQALELSWNIASETFDQAQKLTPLSEYSDQIDALLVTGLSDPNLMAHIKQQPEGPILYTGGGIVPKKLLNLSRHRFLHIHPGYLPDVRGADCTLWSPLLTDHPSASCFYMAPGIDTGDIIERHWLAPLNIKLPPVNNTPIDDKMLYRAVFSFIDPWVRTVVLKEVLFNHQQWEQIKAQPQTQKQGATYHFMHAALIKDALLKFFS